MGADDDDEEDERRKQLEEYRKTATDKELRDMNQMVYQMRGMGQKPPPPPPAEPEVVEEVVVIDDGPDVYEASAAAKRGDKLIRTLQALLNVARLPNMRKALPETMMLAEVVQSYDEGRGAFMTFLKESGVRNLTDRQGLTQVVSSAKNLGTLRPYRDEYAATAANLAGVAGPTASMTASDAKPLPSACLAEAVGLKEIGNAAFKDGSAEKLLHALDAYADAIHSAEMALAGPGSAKDTESAAAAKGVLAALHSNTAACLLKLEQWREASRSASDSLKLEPGSTKAYFRRGTARRGMGPEYRKLAEADFAQSAKLDPGNKAARDALASLRSEKKWFGKSLATQLDQGSARAEADAQRQQPSKASGAPRGAGEKEYPHLT